MIPKIKKIKGNGQKSVEQTVEGDISGIGGTYELSFAGEPIKVWVDEIGWTE